MSTRANIHFTYNGDVEANVYKHCDGYPDAMLDVLKHVLRRCRVADQ